MSDIIEVDIEKPGGGQLLARVQLLIASGGALVYPTRTLYGLGAGISSINGLVKILKLKERPEGPFTVMLNRGQLTDFIDIPVKAKALADSALPITMVLPAKPCVSSILTEKDGTLAVRISDSPLMESIIEKVGPITSTSANLAGGPEPRDIKAAMEQLGDGPDLYLDAGEARLKKASTIVHLADGGEAKILRQGTVTEKEVRELHGS